jgi:hypothetical protein
MTTKIEDLYSMSINQIAIRFSQISRQRISQIVAILVQDDDVDTLWKVNQAKIVLKEAKKAQKRQRTQSSQE